VRVLGVDLGRKRIGLAISDASGTLARPLETVSVGQFGKLNDVVERVLAIVARLGAEEDGLAAIVVGMPRRLDGSITDETLRTEAFIDALRKRALGPVVEQDERLTSREAESLLAARERDWQKRKQSLDAASAAVILQDYLDHRARERQADPSEGA
jgi:putative Holliday junction resolvase